MVYGKLLFDLAGVAALAYMAGGPAAETMLANRAAPRETPSANTAVVADDARADGTAPVRSAEDGLFYVWCEVNGTPVRFMVDTGASVVVLTPADARRAGVTVERGGGTRLRTASGASAMRWARMDRVRIAGQELRDLDAAVVSGGLRTSLLGQNLLKRMRGVTIDGNQLEMH